MRLRLIHVFSMLLLSSVLIAVLVMALVTAWHVKDGFNDYLQTRDVERLEQFAEVVSEAVTQAGGLAAWRAASPDLRATLDQFAKSQGLPPRPPAQPEGRPMGEIDARSRGPRPPPLGGAEGFGPRVNVVAPDGTPFFSRRMWSADAPVVDRPIRVAGAVVALARLRVAGPVPSGVEARFLRNQYLGIFFASIGLVLVALVGAWWVSRRLVQALQAVQQATARIAGGEFDVRVQVSDAVAQRTDELGDLVRDVNKMALSLSRMDQSRRRWLADVSHELRTPLTVLRGEIEAIIDGVNVLQPRAIVSLHEEVVQLNKLVDDLHLLAMSDLSALPCHFTELDAAALLDSVVQRFFKRAHGAGLNLSLSGVDNQSWPVRWDRLRIEQLLCNVLENCLRYTDAPGQIVVKVHAVKQTLRISVDDSAPGVVDTAIGLLFEPLYRTDAARSRQHGGSGLGLAICRAIVLSHGGRIAASASALGGLLIHIEMPFEPGGRL